MKFRLYEAQTYNQKKRNIELKKAVGIHKQGYGVHHLDDTKNSEGLKNDDYIVFYKLFDDKHAQDVVHSIVYAAAVKGGWNKFLDYLNQTGICKDKDGNNITLQEAIQFQIDVNNYKNGSIKKEDEENN